MNDFDKAISRAPIRDYPPRRPMLGHPLMFMFAVILFVSVTLVIVIGNKALGQAAYDAANHEVERY
jgi:hypothetical protein